MKIGTLYNLAIFNYSILSETLPQIAGSLPSGNSWQEISVKR